MSKQRQNSQFNQCLLGPLMQSLDMHTLHFVFLPLVLVEHTSHSALSKQGSSSSGETNNQLCSRLPGGGGTLITSAPPLAPHNRFLFLLSFAKTRRIKEVLEYSEELIST